LSAKGEGFSIDYQILFKKGTIYNNFIPGTGTVDCGLDGLANIYGVNRPVGEGGSEKEERDDR
jgi:hypothetical protein